jgi:site-specific DNA-cytosine methylase
VQAPAAEAHPSGADGRRGMRPGRRATPAAYPDRAMTGGLRVLELFCGIGGVAAALGPSARIVAAIDQNRLALDVYRTNFAHAALPRAVESMKEAELRAWEADLWWLSPPCTPFTRRGRGRDLDDPRARGLVAAIELAVRVRPRYVALENVAGFEGSRARAWVRSALERGGYDVRETLLCPTELGAPNRRLRFYLVAGLDGLGPWPPRTGPSRTVSDALDPAPAAELWCDPTLAARYAGALHIVDPGDPHASTACFTSAYGRSPVRSGSYLATPAGLRRFSPAEILRLLDFPAWFRLPGGLSLPLGWRLAGNSVSIRAVRWVLGAVPGLLPREG